MITRLQINELSDRTAATIAAAVLVDDPYHRSIQYAAKRLVAQGHGDAEYRTQWSSTNTSWYIASERRNVIIGGPES